MSSTEKRAWLSIGSMYPIYSVYFLVQLVAPDMFASFAGRLGFLAIVASVHAAIYLTGLLIIRRHEHGDHLFADERDRSIDARATRVAYFVMLIGLIVVGVVMPFGDHGWKIANAALFCIVLTEGAAQCANRNGLPRNPAPCPLRPSPTRCVYCAFWRKT